MIKRSLLWVLASYCIGIVLRDRLFLVLWAVLFCYLLFAVFQCKSKRFSKLLQSFGRTFIILPAVCLLGAFLGGLQAAEYPLDAVLFQKTAAVCEGNVRAITEMKSGYCLELSNIRLVLREDVASYYKKGKLLVYCDEITDIAIGNRLRVVGDAVPLSVPENDGQFDERAYYRAQRVCCKFYADRLDVLDDSIALFREGCRKIRARFTAIYEEILPQKHAGIIGAILLGEKAALDTDTKELYQRNGIAHILAISGLHVSLLGVSLFFLIRKAGSPLILAAGATVLMLLFYGFLTDFGISTQRAVGMLILAMLAKLLGRSYDSRSACALCALLILLVNPMQLFQTGFQLSFAASFGISYFSRELEAMRFHKGKRVRDRLLFALLSGLTPQLVTAPIILNSFYELPLYAVFLNLPVIGLLSWLVLLSIVSGFVGIFSVSLGRFFAGGVFVILELYERLCQWMEKLPAPIWLYGKPRSLSLLFYFGMILLFFVLAAWLGKRFRRHEKESRYRRGALLVLCLLPLAFLCTPGEDRSGGFFKEAELTVDFLSVGQGDCAVVRSKDGEAYLIDCGSLTVNDVGEYRLEPYLKYHGISKLEAVFLSHPDADHISGVMELLEQTNAPKDFYRGSIQIRNLVLPAAFLPPEEALTKEALTKEAGEKRASTSFSEKDSKRFDELIALANKKGIRVIPFEPGNQVLEESAHPLTFSCLHPDREYSVKDSNDASMVLRMDYGKLSVLFVGDVGKKGERALIEAMDPLRDRQVILKVAHHGSKNSSSLEFLEAVKPRVSVISCGANNRFGHPHQKTLEALQQVESYVCRTDTQGMISVEYASNEAVLVRCRRQASDSESKRTAANK